jgi:geranylgeranyl diphosphate synthase type I
MLCYIKAPGLAFFFCDVTIEGIKKCFDISQISYMQKFKQSLAQFKLSVDREIEDQLDKLIIQCEKQDSLMTQALRHTKNIILSGGKRIRGALLFYGYLGSGGRDKKRIIKISAAFEIIHMFLLIHDDIIDHGALRHGKRTVHLMIAGKKGKKLSPQKASHLGESVGIILGELLYSFSNKIILEAGFDCKTTLSAMNRLQEIISTTILGQSQDIKIEYGGYSGESDVLAMYENKTAKYTFEGPLQAGMLLAGCSDKKAHGQISNFAVPLGIAFQIQDDILGIFGSEKKIGKSAVSDIAEGKITLLVVKTRQLANESQRKKFNHILGKKNVSPKEIGTFQQIVKDSGALEYARKMAAEKLAQGRKEIEKAIILPESKRFLLGLVQYLEEREV